MDSSSIMIWSVLFGGIGIGFFIYGKKQKAVVPFLVGLTLCIFPYFMTSLTMMLIVGVILIAIPYFMKL